LEGTREEREEEKKRTGNLESNLTTRFERSPRSIEDRRFRKKEKKLQLLV